MTAAAHSDSDAGPSAVPPPGRYRLDPERSSVRADVKAMFGLLTVHGTFRLRSGEVQIADDPARCSVTAIVDADSFASGNAKRDRDVTAPGLLDAGTYPEITFVSDRVRQTEPVGLSAVSSPRTEEAPRPTCG